MNRITNSTGIGFRIRLESDSEFDWNLIPNSTGIGFRIQLESNFEIDWNRIPNSTGIGSATLVQRQEEDRERAGLAGHREEVLRRRQEYARGPLSSYRRPAK